SCRIQHHRPDRMDDRILLHIISDDLIHPEFKEFPQHADRHRETECNDRRKQRRQIEHHLLAAVQKIHKRKADRRGKEPVQSVEHSVPEGKHQVEFTDLSEDLRRKYKDQDDDLQGGRQFHLECHLYEAWRHKKHQGQHAEEHILIIPGQELQHHHHNDKKPQDKIHDKRAPVFPQFHIHRFSHILKPAVLLPVFHSSPHILSVLQIQHEQRPAAGRILLRAPPVLSV